MNSVLGRLKQVNALWHQAELAYFEPAAFRAALRSCITTARTVTFILHSAETFGADMEQLLKSRMTFE
jgi:hypothetical protein